MSNFDEALYLANSLNIDTQIVFDAHIRALNWVDSIVENICRSVY